MRDWIEACWKDLGDVEHMRLMVGCWAMWEHRNKVVFESITPEPLRVVQRTRDVVEEIEGAEWGTSIQENVRERRSVEGSGNEGWQVPQSGFVKINVDAGVKQGEGVGSGAVCRDENGGVLWGLSWKRQQSWELHVAEAMAVYDGG
ncbi:uncharacterized protein LOC141651770 [Silene latifolia]|uniref:uncharacterized protein LOC141651770 n=1 Tax=Silene latifolia TaxID=37657 RepID=UPI003D773472